MARTTGYSLVGYGDMITDHVRMDAYARALEAAIRPGCTVLDIGAGTGIFSLLACRFGAGRVDAVEPEEEIQVARPNADANGYADRITFHQAVSSKVELPRRADVIVSDLRGILPQLQHHIPAIIDARERLLVPGGRLISQADELWAALVDAPDLYRNRREPWRHNTLGLDLSAGHPQVVNSWGKARLKPENLLVPPQHWATLDYATIDGPNVAGTLNWTVEGAGTGHGVAVWFDATLGEGIGFSNAPGEPELIYGQAFFPWPEAVELTPGDEVSVRLRADLVGDDYTWRWRTEIGSPESPRKAHVTFEQSTFFADLISPEKLHRQEGGHAPALTIEGQVEGYLLARMDGRTTLEEIARDAAARFPEHFPDWKAALTRAGELSAKYGK